MNKLLTPLELKVMNLLWKKKKAFVKEILEVWPTTPKPAYNTISTTIRILQGKGYISHEAFGRTHRYYPKVSKLMYQKRLAVNVLENVFSGSVTSLVSALVDTDHLSNKELDEIQTLIDKNKKKKS